MITNILVFILIFLLIYYQAKEAKCQQELKRLRLIRDKATILLELPGSASEPERESAHWELEEALRQDLKARGLFDD